VSLGLRSGIGCLALAVGCSHESPARAGHQADEVSIRVGAYSAFLRGKGKADSSPVVNCLGYTRAQNGLPPHMDVEVIDEEPEVLRGLEARPHFVAPFSTCRRPPLTVDGKTVEYAIRIEIESIERPSPDLAVVTIGLIPIRLDGPPGIFYGEGWRLRLERVDGRWVEAGREPGWRP